MTSRAEDARDFLRSTVWADADRQQLAGDASHRKYDRLTLNGKTAVLMDAPRKAGEDVRPFVRIARYLRSLGLSAPDILAEDVDRGFLILEDLGDDLFARVLDRQPELETELYATAVDALIALHQADPPDVATYTVDLMTDLAATAITRYAAAITGRAENPAEFADRFKPILTRLTDAPPVLVQRDYHAENLLWLPDRQGIARVGMLDFQDAMLGHPAYDLVSILQDARRDVPRHVEEQMIARYTAATNWEPGTFRAAYAALGAQRNLRILGVFAKLSLDMGKAQYVDLVPRVWGLLQRDLAHPALADLTPLLRDVLPEPTEQALTKLRPA